LLPFSILLAGWYILAGRLILLWDWHAVCFIGCMLLYAALVTAAARTIRLLHACCNAWHKLIANTVAYMFVRVCICVAIFGCMFAHILTADMKAASAAGEQTDMWPGKAFHCIIRVYLMLNGTNTAITSVSQLL
jgi:hypothetical protein